MAKTTQQEVKKEAVKTKTEATKPKTEAAKPKTEEVKPKTEAAKPKTEAAKPKTEAAKPKTEAAKPKTEAAKPKTEEAKATVGGKVPAVRKSAALAEPEKKKLPAKTKQKAKTEPAKKETAKPAANGKAAEKVVVLPENFFEIDGAQIREEDIRTRIEEAYKDAGHRISAMKKLQVYYNFAERRAYYVINGKAEGLYIEF